tara:strand:- start:5151 stop:5486 length:336 start_codon:yes stop_codon:yes gene_type:complete
MKYTFVEIAKTKIPIKFGFNSLRKYSARTNTSLNDFNKIAVNMSLDQALQLILCGIEDGYRSAKQECIYNIDTLSDLIDEDHDAISKCMDIFADHMGGNNDKKKGKVKAKK